MYPDTLTLWSLIFNTHLWKLRLIDLSLTLLMYGFHLITLFLLHQSYLVTHLMLYLQHRIQEVPLMRLSPAIGLHLASLRSITSYPGISSSTSSSTSSSSSSLLVPTHSTSSVPPSFPTPNHSMVTYSKKILVSQFKGLCINATLYSKAESFLTAQPSKMQPLPQIPIVSPDLPDP